MYRCCQLNETREHDPASQRQPPAHRRGRCQGISHRTCCVLVAAPLILLQVAVADGADVSALKGARRCALRRCLRRCNAHLGKGFEVLHAHADALWGLGSKLVPPAFSAGEVFALTDAAAAAAAAELAAVSLAPPTAAPAPEAAEVPVAAAAAAAAAEGPELDALLEQVLPTACLP